MRLLGVMTAVVLLAAGSGVLGGVASATTATAAAPTVKVVVRPVTAAGYPRAAFSVTDISGTIDCSAPDASVGAVDRDIVSCYPTVYNGVACWLARVPRHVLCLQNAMQKKLARIRDTGTVAQVFPPSGTKRAPLAMVLGNGDRCQIRFSGSGPNRQGHPSWGATYECRTSGYVWATPSRSAHLGVDESAPSWTVLTGGTSGPLTVRHVAKAFFVGTSAL